LSQSILWSLLLILVHHLLLLLLVAYLLLLLLFMGNTHWFSLLLSQVRSVYHVRMSVACHVVGKNNAGLG
jgi:hypothetical protein